MHHDSSAPRHGIVVASGYGLKIYVERGTSLSTTASVETTARYA